MEHVDCNQLLHFVIYAFCVICIFRIVHCLSLLKISFLKLH